jgi:hypothetical protein
VNIDEIVEFACGSAPLKSIEPTYNLCEQVGKLKSHYNIYRNIFSLIWLN